MLSRKFKKNFKIINFFSLSWRESAMILSCSILSGTVEKEGEKMVTFLISRDGMILRGPGTKSLEQFSTLSPDCISEV